MKSRTINSRNYNVGVQTVNLPTNVVRKFTGMGLSLTRETWPNGVNYTQSDGTVVSNIVIVIRFQSSLDGTNWALVGEVPFVGGVRVNSRGETVLTSTAEFNFYDPNTGVPVAKDGDLRIEAQILVPLRTEITVTLLEPGD